MAQTLIEGGYNSKDDLQHGDEFSDIVRKDLYIDRIGISPVLKCQVDAGEEKMVNINSQLHSDSLERTNNSNNSSREYESSPESNFPYTPIDSLESCTSNSSVGHEMIQSIDDHGIFRSHILDDDFSSKVDIFINNTETNTGNELLQNDKECVNPLHNDKIDLEQDNTTGKFLIDDFELDKEIEQMIYSFNGRPKSIHPEPGLEKNVHIPSVAVSKSQELSKKPNDGRQLESVLPAQAQFPRKRANSSNNSTKKNEGTKRRKNKTGKPNAQPQNSISSSSNEENKFLKCFSILRTNYLSLCESYNKVLDKLEFVEEQNKALLEKTKAVSDSEREKWKMEKDRFLLEREDMKAYLDGLLHEVTVLRQREKAREDDGRSRHCKL
ncbi:uncharacterized protein C5L36_0B06910 [Pichia kudriavzevii]|uniref:Uncharacterized protein n=1 Tax=Pichia kudriavzevii TaxID=4909 RepID=A0A2U9R2Q0_PICKU|nr:uncharacterized protein C5L36_0B06910 [Pichia kudriavzevii]AWU75446.1 hypothetical protein C5L36_0B06910 [Pichia kudriavzevii]